MGDNCERCAFRRPECPDDRYYTCDVVERLRVRPEDRAAASDYLDDQRDDCPSFAEA